MTTNFHCYKTDNAFNPNDVFRIRQEALLSDLDIGAIGWILQTDNVRSAQESCCDHVLSEIANLSNDLEFWLLACHTAWQPDNVVSRKLKLWKSLKRRGLDLPSSQVIESNFIESLGKIKWYSAIKFGATDSKKVMRIIQEEPASLVVVTPPESINLLNSIISTTWERNEVG